jgi:catechol 2,3-dioxygenase-like lactoylglutathione lyase family enzyme
MIAVERTNTVLYCERWVETVAFYRDTLGLDVAFENDWFVEFAVHPGAYVSIADAARTSVRPGDGSGITLSWRVADVTAVRSALAEAAVSVGEPRRRFGADVIDVFDPSGNRIEFWSGSVSDG